MLLLAATVVMENFIDDKETNMKQCNRAMLPYYEACAKPAIASVVVWADEEHSRAFVVELCKEHSNEHADR